MPATEPVNLKEKVRHLPDKPGVYLMRDRLGRIIYVGKAKSLKKRVSSYFMPSRAARELHPKIRALIQLIADFDTIEVKSEPEALLLEGRLIKEWRPKYNTDFTDDKRFLLVRVDPMEPLPKFRLTRIRKDTRSRYFGPFAHSGLLRKTLAQMRRQFGILLGDATPRRLDDGRWQLYDDVRQDLYSKVGGGGGGEAGAVERTAGEVGTAGGAGMAGGAGAAGGNEITEADYRARVEAACEFLDGKSREWLAQLREQMSAAAAKHEFEKAAELRDIVFALEGTLQKTRKFERNHPVIATDTAAMRALGEALGLPAPPRTLECFDISHISGTFVVASMVHFADGRPDKNNYRRFQIKSFIGNDDFRAMEEVVGRRYRRLREEGKPFPDLIVIDGGRGQIAAALKAFAIIDAPPPPSSDWPKNTRRSFSPTNAPRSISPLRIPHSASCNACATKRIVLPTPTTPTCVPAKSARACSTILTAWAKCAAPRSLRTLATSTASAPPPKHRSARSPVLVPNSPPNSTPGSTTQMNPGVYSSKATVVMREISCFMRPS